MTSRHQLEEHLLDLGWSLWTELGIAGARRQHQNVAIMPEELLLLTSVLSPLDPRLRDESVDWCSHYYGYVSTSRLRRLFAAAQDALKNAFSPYAATVNTMAPTRWPALDDASPWRLKVRGRSRLDRLESPALLHLRLRAIFGTDARADVIALFLGSEAPELSIAEVADVGYTKRAIANVLAELSAAGILRAAKIRNQLRYRWARREALRRLVDPLPREIPKWQPIVAVVLGLYWFIGRTEAMPPVVRGVEATAQLASIQGPLASLGWTPPALGQDPERAWDKLAKWAISLARALASGSMGAS